MSDVLNFRSLVHSFEKAPSLHLSLCRESRFGGRSPLKIIVINGPFMWKNIQLEGIRPTRSAHILWWYVLSQSWFVSTKYYIDQYKILHILWSSRWYDGVCESRRWCKIEQNQYNVLYTLVCVNRSIQFWNLLENMYIYVRVPTFVWRAKSWKLVV